MEEGTVLQWLKAVGDEVAVGDELVEIETDKANMAYESDVAGTLTEILVEEGETVSIGTPIAMVGETEEAAAAEPEEREEPVATETSTTTAAPPRVPAVEHDDGHRPKASPLARRLAKEQGLDLSQLRGSGPGGRIVKADVEKAGADAPSAPAPAPPAAVSEPTETAKGQVTYEDLSKTQQVIARRMAESKATAPHFYLRVSVDMSEAVAGREQVKARALPGDVVPSFNDMVVKACALALREHPRANGAYRDGRFELYSRVNVGVAVAANDALVVPTLFDADRKGLRQIASESRELARKVRDGEITPPELSGATFTVSNLGMYGIEGFSAVINPPQAAILAVGAIEERPVVRDGRISTAHLMQVDLACDHRILYGAPAAEFLARVRALLEEPLSLAL
jgi:pyruvate dehydrogenase E2 component (dihydrolipoamide acetyltransferase)